MARSSVKHTPKPSVNRKRLLLLPLALIALYVILPQLKEFHSSLATIQKAQISWLVVAFGATVLTYIAAASVYVLLAKRRLAYGRTLLVQIASMFANRLLPAGIGAIGINYEFLRRNKHTGSQAVAVVAANNILGFLGNMLLLATALLFGNIDKGKVHIPHLQQWVYVPIVTIGVLGLIIGWSKYALPIRRTVGGVFSNLISYRRRPLRFIGAFLSSVVLTASYTVCLYASLEAIGMHLTLSTVFIVMTLGVAGGTVTPTPGGIGGAEAGLVAGLLIYGLSSADALAAALLYRLFTYWLALAVGTIAFIYVERRHYV